MQPVEFCVLCRSLAKCNLPLASGGKTCSPGEEMEKDGQAVASNTRGRSPEAGLTHGLVQSEAAKG